MFIKKYINNKYLNDFYFKKSKKLNLISRSWFKLFEIDKKYNILKKNMNVIDLGSSPGGWSKYIKYSIGSNGNIFSCDINNMNFIENINFFKGNLKNINDFNKFIKFVNIDKINVITSDMLSNTTGFNLIDYYNNLDLINIALKLCFIKLINGGSFIFKLLQNNNNNFFLKKINTFFKKISLFKPNSSHNFSREFYIVAKYFKNNI